jgi:hypothetical protein
MNLQIIPFKNNNNTLQKYHIVDSSDNILLYKICNVYSSFGRQTETDHRTKNKISQHRLNICFSCDDINQQNKSYMELKHIITTIESYFQSFEELINLELVSNIINRDKYGIVIRFHLKTFKNKTISKFISINTDTLESEWISFDKDRQFNFEFHPDCLWIDNINKKFGVSLVIDKVFQLTSL